MAGIIFNISNIFVLLATLYPVFIVCFLFLASIFNHNIQKGLILLLGIFITSLFCYALGNGLSSDGRINRPITCDLFTLGSTNYNGPSTQQAICWFVFVYLLLPMLKMSNQSSTILNPYVLSITGGFAFINFGYNSYHNCAHLGTGLILGGLLGALCGLVWFYIWFIRPDTRHLLFYNELVSNNAICSRPSQQHFKCEVYKGGELISQSTI